MAGLLQASVLSRVTGSPGQWGHHCTWSLEPAFPGMLKSLIPTEMQVAPRLPAQETVVDWGVQQRFPQLHTRDILPLVSQDLETV